MAHVLLTFIALFRSPREVFVFPLVESSHNSINLARLILNLFTEILKLDLNSMNENISFLNMQTQ